MGRQRRERRSSPWGFGRDAEGRENVVVEQDAKARRGVVVLSGVVVVRVNEAKRPGGFYTPKGLTIFVFLRFQSATIIGDSASSGTLWKMLPPRP